MRKINLIFTVVLFLFVSCSNDVDYGEQYRKEFYIVGSSQTLQYAFHEIDKASPGHISVYCTGSELLSKDAVVNYKVDKEYLDRFNRNEYGKEEENYFQVVPEDKINFEQKQIIVEKGKEYGLLNFTINTEGLDFNKVYIVPLTLTDAPGYDISETQSRILYVVGIVNQYQGIYRSTYSQENPDGSGTSGTAVKITRALTSTQLLVPLSNYSNKDGDLDFSTQYYLINLNPDNTLTIKPYLQAVVEQNPDEQSYYDPEKKEFHIFYWMKDNYDENIYFEEVLAPYL